MTNKIRITKKFCFEAAHILDFYDGLCKNLHGHSYKLFVTVIGTPEININSPKLGMVIDFKILKSIINENIIEKFDHSIIVNKKNPLLPILLENNKVNVVDFQPSAENMLLYFVDLLNDKLPIGIKLFSMKLYETEDSYAEWFDSDNKN